MGFIKVTAAVSGVKIRINTANIESYGPDLNNPKRSSILPIGAKNDDEIYIVKETPEEIDELIAAAGEEVTERV